MMSGSVSSGAGTGAREKLAGSTAGTQQNEFSNTCDAPPHQHCKLQNVAHAYDFVLELLYVGGNACHAVLQTDCTIFEGTLADGPAMHAANKKHCARHPSRRQAPN